ncbi:MAG: GrpB family protein [Acidimicrobiales bacterium]
MRVYRFDPEVSRPVDHFGSSFRLGSIVEDGAAVTAHIVHLGPGGLVGRHPSVGQQLFAVVAGTGWVTDGGDRRRPVRAGQAVVWDAGEQHSAGTDEGLTAVSFEGIFRVTAYSVTKEIVVEDYNPEWSLWYEQIRATVWSCVAPVAVRIDHVGSTAVPGLAAEPIVDMDVVVAGEDDIRPTIDALAVIGYRWTGDLGVSGRQAFRPPSPCHLPAHHLYLVVEDSRAHQDHRLLRDLLRADPDARERYGRLKRHNAVAADGDIDRYVAAKAGLVAELLARARAQHGLPPVEYWEPALD